MSTEGKQVGRSQIIQLSEKGTSLGKDLGYGPTPKTVFAFIEYSH